MQIGAYAMAHDYVHNSEIKQGVVMICTPDLYYQEFKISGTRVTFLEAQVSQTIRYVSRVKV